VALALFTSPAEAGAASAAAARAAAAIARLTPAV
jgi:hypothetical protein